MSEWTKQRLDQMIADGVEENLSLDYKRADSLAKTDGKKAEVTKDVSSFANSSGGVLIYGVAKFDDEQRKHLPERLDPIQRSEISKEWLDQVIQTIQPRIEGVVIHPITISEPDNIVCYVVEVPQSHTAHMARDHRYHKRHNFTTAQMEDYEVRDVMSRRTHPKIKASIFINRRADYPKPGGLILVRIENVGNVSAHQVMVDLQLPVDLDGPYSIANTPIVIDEPEAHLDSALIANYLVELVKTAKLNRQIIFATHNANFVINGDAELIHVLSMGDDKLSKIQGITIEDLDHRAQLLALEGGREAFQKREHRYGIG